VSTYVPTDWVDGTTPLDEAHLDKIEQELVLLDGRKVPAVAGQDGKWLTVAGGAMVWAAAPAGGGGGLDWEGAYGAATPYVKGDVVTYGGVVYGAVNDSTGQTPPPATPVYPNFTPLPLLTALPSSPFDGQQIILTDSLTAPTFTWLLRYVAAKASNKWVFIGGAPAVTEVLTSEALAGSANTYNAPPTAGPNWTIPVSGDYLVATSHHFTAVSGAGKGYMSYDIGATGAVDADASSAFSSSPGDTMMTYRERRKTGLVAGTVLTAKYKQGGNNTGGTISTRAIIARPIAVGG